MEWLWAHAWETVGCSGQHFSLKNPSSCNNCCCHTEVTKGNMRYSLQLKQLVVTSVNPDCRNIFFESKERPAQVKINHVLYCILCVWSYWRKKLTCLFWYMTHWMFVKKVFCTFIMCLVKTSTFHLRHLLKVDFDVCFLTFLFVVLLVFPFCNLPLNNLNNALDIA